MIRVCLKIFDWSKMAPFRPCCVAKMLIMRCITPLFAPCLDKNVLIFACNPKFKHPLRRYKNTTGYYTSQVFTISGPVFQTNLRKTAFR